jgi:hypothetical protein
MFFFIIFYVVNKLEIWLLDEGDFIVFLNKVNNTLENKGNIYRYWLIAFRVVNHENLQFL